MKVLGICGTPRKRGNSEILLDAALSPFREKGWEVSRVLLSEQLIRPCTGCETCVASHACFLQDDMQEVYREYGECDAIVTATPVYWRNVPGQLKSLIDRSFAVHEARLLAGKLGGAIAVGRGSGGGQSIVLNVIHNFYLSSGMLCVPGELNGVSAVADRPGDILSQPGRLDQARILGENILGHLAK